MVCLAMLALRAALSQGEEEHDGEGGIEHGTVLRAAVALEVAPVRVHHRRVRL